MHFVFRAILSTYIHVTWTPNAPYISWGVSRFRSDLGSVGALLAAPWSLQPREASWCPRGAMSAFCVGAPEPVVPGQPYMYNVGGGQLFQQCPSCMACCPNHFFKTWFVTTSSPPVWIPPNPAGAQLRNPGWWMASVIVPSPTPQTLPAEPAEPMAPSAPTVPTLPIETSAPAPNSPKRRHLPPTQPSRAKGVAPLGVPRPGPAPKRLNLKPKDKAKARPVTRTFSAAGARGADGLGAEGAEGAEGAPGAEGVLGAEGAHTQKKQKTLKVLPTPLER